MDHFNYCNNNYHTDSTLLIVHYDIQDNQVGDNEKFGDERLLILIRSCSYLYNKNMKDYRNAKLKENVWKEMTEILNVISNFELKINIFINLKQKRLDKLCKVFVARNVYVIECLLK